MLTAAHAVSSHSTSPVAARDAIFLEALRAEGPLDETGADRDLYAGLIGDWDAEVVDHLPGGNDRRQSAEMHFAWVLEGRAVQDLWISPARHERSQSGFSGGGRTAPPEPSPAGDGNRYGTTLRVYDPRLGAWRVTWWNPVTGVETRLVGRRVGSQIVQTGSDAEGHLIRWVFVDLQDDRFHWRGERSADGGHTWTCDTEYFARRRAAAPGRAAAAAGESRVAWGRTDRPGLETVRLVRNAAGTAADGRVLVVLDGAPVSAHYRVEHDAAWRFRQATIEVDGSDFTRSIEIRRDASGPWTVDGSRRPDLDGCEDFDLAATPYTNTSALASRPLSLGESRRLRVAWVQVPSLDVRAVDQEYTRLGASGADGGIARYRYRNIDSGFTGELTVDADGLVIDYGPWARR